MKSYADDFHITLDIVDEVTGITNESTVCKRRIAQKAAEHVNSGDVLFMNNGDIALLLAEELKQKKDITVITNSMRVFNMLAGNSTMKLISNRYKRGDDRPDRRCGRRGQKAYQHLWKRGWIHPQLGQSSAN